MNITTIGIDLAKNVFQVHGTDERGKAVLTKVLRRSQMMQFFAQRPPCLIGMEACGSAHFWARKLTALGHTVKLMAPQFVRPYVKTNKNDARDAEAICEAVGRPSMRFVAIKSQAQQDMTALHRVRSLLIRERTALMNEMRGLLAECGVVAPRGPNALRQLIASVLTEADEPISGLLREILSEMNERLR